MTDGPCTGCWNLGYAKCVPDDDGCWNSPLGWASRPRLVGVGPEMIDSGDYCPQDIIDLIAAERSVRAERDRFRVALETIARGVDNVETDTLAVGHLRGVALAALKGDDK